MNTSYQAKVHLNYNLVTFLASGLQEAEATVQQITSKTSSLFVKQKMSRAIEWLCAI
jgi:hypothetical protein